jgi:hypothetical protein
MNLTLLRNKRQADRDKLQAELAALPQKIEEAVDVAIRENPDRSPFQRGLPAFQLRARQRELETSLANLNAEIPIRERHAKEEADREAQAEYQRLLDRAAGYAPAQAELWKEFVARIEEARSLYDQIADSVEEADAFDQEVRHSMTYVNGENESEWATTIRPAVRPMPATFGMALEVVWQTAADPTRKGYRDTEGGGLRMDEDYFLVGITPDLRDQLRTLQVSPAVPTRAAMPVMPTPPPAR